MAPPPFPQTFGVAPNAAGPEPWEISSDTPIAPQPASRRGHKWPLVVAAVMAGVCAFGGVAWFALGRGADANGAKPGGANAALTSAQKPYVAAMMKSVMSDPANRGLQKENRCLATAIVQTYGTNAFAKAGLTPAVLAKPNSSLGRLPKPTPDQSTTLTGAVQSCGVALHFATAIASGVHASDSSGRHCLAGQLAPGHGTDGFVANMVVERQPGTAESVGIVKAVGRCFDLVALVLQAGGLDALTATQRDCVAKSLKDSGLIEAFFALEISGKRVPPARYQEALRPRLVPCLTATGG
jgi:hypothetical protein